jgi:hypothetical protein
LDDISIKVMYVMDGDKSITPRFCNMARMLGGITSANISMMGVNDDVEIGYYSQRELKMVIVKKNDSSLVLF